MKTLWALAPSLSFVFQNAFAIPADSLHQSCSGSLTIIGVSNPKYSPEVLRGRYFKPEEATFEAKALLEPAPGCSDMAKKYGASFPEEELVLRVNLDPADLPAPSDDGVEATAQTFLQTQGRFKLTQQFGWRLNDELPLFPLAHSEWLNITGTVTGPVAADLTWQGAVDTAAVYGIVAYDDKSSQEKLEVARTLVALLRGGMKIPAHWFEALLSPRHFETVKDQVVLTDLLVEVLAHEAQLQYLTPFFFDFNVGGSTGQPIGEALATLSASPDVMSSAEKVSLVARFPTLVLREFQIQPGELSAAYAQAASRLTAASATGQMTAYDKEIVRLIKKSIAPVVQGEMFGLFSILRKPGIITPGLVQAVEAITGL